MSNDTEHGGARDRFQAKQQADGMIHTSDFLEILDAVVKLVGIKKTVDETLEGLVEQINDFSVRADSRALESSDRFDQLAAALNQKFDALAEALKLEVAKTQKVIDSSATSVERETEKLNQAATE